MKEKPHHTFWSRGWVWTEHSPEWYKPYEGWNCTIGAAWRDPDIIERLNEKGAKQWLLNYMQALADAEKRIRETQWDLAYYKQKYGEMTQEEKDELDTRQMETVAKHLDNG